MIRLVHANATGPLLDALADDVAAARRAVGPLEPLVVATSGAASRAHIEQGLAHRLGIAAHLSIRALRAVIADVVSQSLPGVDLAGPDAIAGALLELLHRPELDEAPELAPVARYLDAGDPDAVDERRVDLAGVLGRLFDAYLAHRPEWAKAWREGAAAPPGVPDEAWAWQGALFRRLVEPDTGPLAPARPTAEGTRRRWLLVDAIEAADRWRGPARIFVFDAPVRSPTMARALERIAEATEVHLYHLNPCLEFWEDVPRGFSARELARRLSSRADAAREGAPLEEAGGGADPPALRLWGLPGREELRLVSALAGWSADPRFEVPEPDTRLGALRRDVLLRAPERASRAPPAETPDRSLEVTSAPGVRRECEAIAAEVWRLLTEREDLRLSDVVVALGSSEADLYRGQLAAAFAEAGDLPFHELDVPLAADSRIIDVVRLLLALPRSGFTRQDVLRIITHPTVRARHRIGETDDWATWCDRLGVVHGADHADHEGTYIPSDLFHWDQGLRRLALGAFMAGEGAGRPDPIELGGRSVLPTDFAAHELPSAGRLVALVRSLVGDARALARTETSLADWSVGLRELVGAYVGPESDDDERDLYRVLAAIDDLARVDPSGTQVRFRTAARLLEDRLDGLTTHRGQPLAEAVVIAPLAAVASLPFEVCFLPGLGEGRFPAPHRPPALDLRRGARRPGDVTPRMRDEYAFLLRLLATRSAVRLSYVGRDPRTGDALAPASTLAELIGILERGYISEGESLIAQLPLRRLDAPGPSVAARAEADARALAEDLARALPPRAPRPDVHTLLSLLPPQTGARLARRLALPELPRAAAPGGPRARVGLANLRRFLEDPFQGWCRQVLGLSEADVGSDPLAQIDEPFELERLPTLALLRDTFLGWLASGEAETTLLGRYERAARRLELAGQLPTGVFGRATNRAHARVLEAWARAAREALVGRRARLVRLELGRAAASEAGSILVPALELERAVITGPTEPLFEDGGCLVLRDREVNGERDRIRNELRAWLAQLAWVGSERPAPGPWRAFIADGGPRLHRGSLAEITPSDARRLLETLAAELLAGGHVHLLPLDAQLRLREARAKGAGTKKLRDLLGRATPDDFGPLRNVPLEPPPLDEALDTIERRLGPFLDARLAEGRR